MKFNYPEIDMKETGMLLRGIIKQAGFSVKDIQHYLRISSNQAIYDWFNGKTLPSINNLIALSILLGKPMNSLLVLKNHINPILCDFDQVQEGHWKIFIAYHKRLNMN